MMKKIFSKAKTSFSGITWPKLKNIFTDTCFVVIATAVLSTLILVWVTGIEIIIDAIVSWL